MQKSPYEAPSFIAIPMAMLCSKTGCPTPDDGWTIGTPAAGGTPEKPAFDPLVSIPADIPTRADGNFMYVFEPRVQLVFEINRVGGFLIRECVTRPARLSDLLRAVRNTHGGVPKNVKDQVYGFLSRLRSSGFRLEMQVVPGMADCPPDPVN